MACGPSPISLIANELGVMELSPTLATCTILLLPTPWLCWGSNTGRVLARAVPGTSFPFASGIPLDTEAAR